MADQPRRRGARAGVAVLAVVVLGAGTVVVIEQLHYQPQVVAASVQTSTATVVRTDLATTLQVGGTLGYAGTYPVANQAPGTYTWLPALGQVVGRGQRLYEVNGQPVILCYGDRPVWRALALGVPDGQDVTQLKQNMIALGFAPAATMIVNDHFDLATYYAVRRWQTALGVPVTGAVGLADIVYAPGPIRVASLQATLGSPAQPGPLLQATGTEPVVSVAIPVTQEYLATVGDHVTVTLADGTTTVPGTITSESTVATQGGGQGSGPAPSNSPSSGNGPAQVTATVRLANPAAATVYDQAPVTVNVTDQSVHGVLAVPINALVALAGGGYGVWVAGHGTRRLVGVHTGLFSDTLVQVSGDIAVGMTVEVPAS
jgi:peptidoglycan hydrolase-like protein with peptidoglycan-binding domain